MGTRNNGGRAGYSKLTSDENMLEQENDAMVSTLATKISTLRNIAIDIDNEAKYQNKYIGGMQDDFDTAGGFLGTSMKRLNNMVAAGSSNRKMMCYMVIILVTVFFVFYYFVGKVRS